MEDKENIIVGVNSPGEDEVFFGKVTEKELRKSAKFARRRTALFNPGFRDDRRLMRYTMDTRKLAALVEENMYNVPVQAKREPKSSDFCSSEPNVGAGFIAMTADEQMGGDAQLDKCHSSCVELLQPQSGIVHGGKLKNHHHHTNAAEAESILGKGSEEENACTYNICSTAVLAAGRRSSADDLGQINNTSDTDAQTDTAHIISIINEENPGAALNGRILPSDSGAWISHGDNNPNQVLAVQPQTVNVSYQTQNLYTEENSDVGKFSLVSKQDRSVCLGINPKISTDIITTDSNSSEFAGLESKIFDSPLQVQTASAIGAFSSVKNNTVHLSGGSAFKHCTSGPLAKVIVDNRGLHKDTVASPMIIRQFDFSFKQESNKSASDQDKVEEILDSSLVFTDNDESMMDNSLRGEIDDVLFHLNRSVDKVDVKPGCSKRLSLGGMSDKDDTVSEANSSMSSGPLTEIMLDGYTLSDRASIEVPKPLFDMQPLAEALPPLKVTTPAILHDENLSAFKTYGSSQDVSALVQEETNTDLDMLKLPQGDSNVGESTMDVDCTSSASTESNGGDSGIEDAESECPSKVSQTSSCHTGSPTCVSKIPSHSSFVTENAQSNSEKSDFVFKETLSPVVNVNLAVNEVKIEPESVSKEEAKGKSTAQKGEKTESRLRDRSESATRTAIARMRSRERNSGPDRTNSFRNLDDDKPGTPSTRRRSKSPGSSAVSDNTRRSRPATRSTTRQQQACKQSQPKPSPSVVTGRLHSPCSSGRCSKQHGISTVTEDGRPLWNSSTVVPRPSLRGTYLSSKASPFSPFRVPLPVTPQSVGESRKGTSGSCRKFTKSRKDPVGKTKQDDVEEEIPIPKLDLDLLDNVKATPRCSSNQDEPGEVSSEDKSISCKQQQTAALQNKQAPRSPQVSRKRACSPTASSPMKRMPLKPSNENVPSGGMRDQQLLQLNERELDAVTNLHTMCNGQQLARFVTKPLAASVIKSTPEPKNPKIQWPHEPVADEVEFEVDSPALGCAPTLGSASKKPILVIRAPDEPFPFSDQPPSPVVIRKTPQKRNANPLSRPLGF